MYFLVITIMYLSTAFFSSYTYGTSLTDSVINSIQTIWIKHTVNIMIAAHCLLTFTLIINTVNQEIEDYCKIPQGKL